MPRPLPSLAKIGLAMLVGCAGSGPGTELAHTSSSGPSVSAADRYFPLEEGRIYQYTTNESGETGMLVARVHRADGTHGELRLSNATKRFVFKSDGVAYDTGAYILKAPLEIGVTWPGEHGGTTRISTVDASPKVLAGSYSSCIVTVEEGGRPQGSRYTTTYCPGVGMVLLEISALGNEARAELKSYGFPVKIE
jgi:hypothetical protein